MKLNKQGVRDLSALGRTQKGDPDTHFGAHQLPGELAAALLTKEGQKVTEFGPALTAETREFLEILAEECAETIQRATKILRFGVRVSPWDGKNTVDKLESEIGDICAALDVLEMIGLIDSDRVATYTDRKLKAFVVEEDPARPRLRHITAALRGKIALRLR